MEPSKERAACPQPFSLGSRMHQDNSQLKLWTPDDEREAPIGDDDWTDEHKLSQIFVDYFKPHVLDERDELTVREYETSINYWVKLTADPAVRRITEAQLVEFTKLLRQQPGKQPGKTMRKATVEKHQRHLAHVFKVLGRRDRRNYFGLGVLRWTPYFAPTARGRGSKTKRSQAKPPFLPAELVALADACRVAHKPRLYGIPPPQWWRSIFATIYNSTWRVGHTFDLRYSWIENGWVTSPASAVKHGDEDEGDMRWPFNQHAQTAVDLIRTPGRDLVFCYRDGDAPKVRPKSWDGCCRRTLDDIFREIKKAAGLNPDDGRMFHAIRRTAILAYERLGRGVGSYMCGHAGQVVTDQHYVGDGLVSDYAANLGQPGWSVIAPKQGGT